MHNKNHRRKIQPKIAPSKLKRTSKSTSKKKNFVFICYSRKEHKFRDEFIELCAPVSEIGIWADINIKAGSDWQRQINEAIDGCKIAVLFVSKSFFNSPYIQESELPELIKAYRQKRIILVPLFITKCYYKGSIIETLQAINEPNRPLRSLPPSHRDDVHLSLINFIVREFNR